MNPFRYLARFLDKNDPSASLKHLAFAAVVTFGCAWLTWGCRKDIDSNWVAAFGLLLAAVTTGKVVGSAPSPAPTVGPAGSPASVLVVSETSPAGSDKT